MKMLIRGGSIAAGYDVQKGYADILKMSLSEKGIEVINRSGFRETSFYGIETFKEDLEGAAPDILLIHFGVDDAFQYVYRSEFQENIVRMVNMAKTRFNPFIFLATSQAFENPHDMDAVCIFYRSLRIVASDLNCELIPVHSYWSGYLEEHHLQSTDLLFEDTRYPNERGHAVIAEVILKWLDKIL